MAQIFQLGAQFEVIVNLAVEDNPAISILGENGLVALLEVDDFQARSPEGKEIRVEKTLLVGPAVNQRSGRLPDSFRRRAPVFCGEAGNPAQRSPPLRLTRRFCEMLLGIQGNAPCRSLSGVPATPQCKTPQSSRFETSWPGPC